MKHAARALLRTPGFALAAIASLAFGIGGDAAMFALADRLLLQPLPVHKPQDLVRLDSVDPLDPLDQRRPYGLTTTMLDRVQTADIFSGVCGFLTPLLTVDFGEHVAAVSGVQASGGCFETLGVRPALGRLLSMSDDRAGAARVVAISYGAWQQDFEGRPDVLDRSLKIDGDSYRIVGVVERDFNGLLVGFPARVYVPLRQARLSPGLTYDSLRATVIARLRKGDTLAATSARLASQWPFWRAKTIPATLADPDRSRYLRAQPRLTPASGGIDYSLRSRFGRPLVVLVAIASMVLVVAAVNVANLAIARAAQRRRETAVRLALGATRWQISRRVLFESIIVFLIATAAGLVLGYWCDRFLLAIFRSTSPAFALDVLPDWRVLGFSATAASVTFLIFALAPALKTSDLDIAALQSASNRLAGGHDGARRAVLVTQVALTVVLVAITGLLTRELASLRSAPLGAGSARGSSASEGEREWSGGGAPRPVMDDLLEAQLSPTLGGYGGVTPPQTYYRSLLQHVAAVPGVLSVALSADRPFGSVPRSVEVIADDGASTTAEVTTVSDRFFETMKIPLVAGEDFGASAASRQDHPVIVSTSLARKLFGSNAALDEFVRIRRGRDVQPGRVIGIARDTVLSNPQARNTVILYENLWESSILYPTLVIRGRADAAALVPPLRNEVMKGGREFPRTIRTLTDTLDASLAQERLLATVSTYFSALGLGLAAVGLYGLLAFIVTGRTNEIGVRMALGADRRDILRLVLADAFSMVATGAAVGAPVAWIAVRTVSRVLFTGAGSAAAPMASALLLLGVAGAVASLVPAARAAMLSPVDAIRRD